MGFRLTVLLTIASVAGMAQRGGQTGGAPGGFQPGRPSPGPGPGKPGFGRGSGWGWRGQRGVGGPIVWPVFPWFGAPLCAPGMYPDALSYWPSGGNCNPDAFAPQSQGVSPVTNVIVNPVPPYFPPPYLPPPGAGPTGDEPTAGDIDAPLPPSSAPPNFAPPSSALPSATPTSSSAHPPDEHKAPSGQGAAGDTSYRAPYTSPAAEEPVPIIVFKTGGMYSVSRYWVKNKNLYFVTTEGETLYAPLALLKFVYPGKASSNRAVVIGNR
jgi:hypothetical protein